MKIKTLLEKNLKVLAIALAAMLIVGLVLAANTTLKADDEEAPPAEPTYEEPAPEPVYEEPAPEPVYEEPAYEEPAPAEETWSEPAQEESWSEPAPAQEEPPVDPALEAYLAALAAEQAAAEATQQTQVIEIPEAQPEPQPEPEPEAEPETQAEQAEEPAESKANAADCSVEVNYEYVGGRYLGLGTSVKLTAKISGFDGTPSYQWQHSTDGSNWADEPGATGASYTYRVTPTTCDYQWRVVVDA